MFHLAQTVAYLVLLCSLVWTLGARYISQLSHSTLGYSTTELT